MKFKTLLLLLLFCFPVLVRADSEARAESAAISHLVTTIRTSKFSFIRNGEAFDGAAAARHILKKYSPSKIHTAEEFIDQCASVSQTTGKPYLVRLDSGRERPLKEWLGEELVRWRAGPRRP